VNDDKQCHEITLWHLKTPGMREFFFAAEMSQNRQAKNSFRQLAPMMIPFSDSYGSKPGRCNYVTFGMFSLGILSNWP